MKSQEAYKIDSLLWDGLGGSSKGIEVGRDAKYASMYGVKR